MTRLTITAYIVSTYEALISVECYVSALRFLLIRPPTNRLRNRPSSGVLDDSSGMIQEGLLRRSDVLTRPQADRRQ